MRSSKFFGKWLIVIMLMAIGIGTFAALSLADKQDDADTGDSVQSEASQSESSQSEQAQPQSYLSNQRKHDIDMDALGTLMGEYQSTDNKENWWHLSIMDDYDEKGPYLSVNDNASGNPGFEGRIMYLQKDLVIVEIDEDLYEGMPLDWKLESEGKYAILDCVSTDEGVKLGYRGSDILFEKDK